MKNDSSLSGRLSTLIEALRLSPSDFMERVSVSKQTYYNLRDGNSKPDYRTINSVLIGFPEISAEWLMRGEGAMLKEETPSMKEFEQLKKQSEVFEEMYFELKKQLPGKPEATTKSLLVDDEEEAARASELFTTPPVQLGVILPIYMEFLIEKYGITFNPSLS